VSRTVSAPPALRLLAAFGCGLLFALGLGLAGMTQPQKVLGFLDVLGEWDPTLAVVMGGAVLSYAVLHRLFLRRPRPLLEERYHLPPPGRPEARQLAGAALFGAGWGLAGLCPAPAVVDLATGLPQVAAFVVAMLAGLHLHDRLHGPAQGGTAREAPMAS